MKHLGKRIISLALLGAMGASTLALGGCGNSSGATNADGEQTYEPVSYTHLDVYKRQSLRTARANCMMLIQKASSLSWKSKPRHESAAEKRPAAATGLSLIHI